MPPKAAPEQEGHLSSAPGVPDIVPGPVARCLVTHWPGWFWPGPGSGTPAQVAATAPPWPATPLSGVGATALTLGAIFFLFQSLDCVTNLLDESMPAKSRRFLW